MELRRTVGIVAIALAMAACGGNGGGTDSGPGPVDSGGRDSGTPGEDSGTPGEDSGTPVDSGMADSGTPVDSGPGDAGGSGFMAFAPCPNEASYATGDTSVTIGPGSTYSPRCLEISAGGMVSIEASGFHPLAGSAAGTAGGPLPAAASAATSTATYTFATPGFYPFRCTAHGPDSATGPTGMAGVVHVVP